MLFNWYELKIYLITIICPWCPFHITTLQIKRKIFHVDVTRGTINAVAKPDHFSCTGNDHICVNYRWLELRIGTVNLNKYSLEVGQWSGGWLDVGKCVYLGLVVSIIAYSSLWMQRLWQFNILLSNLIFLQTNHLKFHSCLSK